MTDGQLWRDAPRDSVYFRFLLSSPLALLQLSTIIIGYLATIFKEKMDKKSKKPRGPAAKMPKTDIGKRLVSLLGGRTYAEFERDVGLPKGIFHKYVRGSMEPRKAIMVKIATATGCSLDWLIMGKESVEKTIVPVVDAERFKTIGTVSAGLWGGQAPRWNDTMEICAQLKVEGHGMSPQINDGDSVIVYRNIPALHGDVAVCAYRSDDGTQHCVIKKLAEDGDFYRLSSLSLDNSDELRIKKRDVRTWAVHGVIRWIKPRPK